HRYIVKRKELLRFNNLTVLTLPQLFVRLRKGVDGELQVFAGMRRAYLRPHPRRTMWNYRIKEADNVNPFLQHPGGELLRLGGIADHDWDDGMNSRFDRESTFR